MPFPLTFNLRYEYDSQKDGITIPAILRSNDKTAFCDAKVDPGAQVCVFQREIGEVLGFDVDSGYRIKLNSLGGTLVAFGHSVTLSTFDMEFDSIVYFAKDYNLPRNLLGREGWLRRVRLAVVDYDTELYLNRYDSPILSG